MKNVIYLTSCVFPAVALLFIIQPSYSQFNFKCQDKRGNAPALPEAYSTNIRINFLYQQYTMEIKYATIGKADKELIEIKSKDKHAKYITRGEKETALYIDYEKDKRPACRITDSTKILEFVDEEFAGENRIFLKAAEVMMYPNMFDLYSVAPDTDTGVFGVRYEACVDEPKVNVSITFAVADWKQSHVPSPLKDVNYPVMAVAEIGNIQMTAIYSNFDPTIPDEALFQPPEDVYCNEFRADRKPPKIPDYFSYNSEIILHVDDPGLAPLVSYRQVYYDYPAGISRMDIYDPLADDSDLSSPIRAQAKSIIHDYNADSQYVFNILTGKCTIDSFKATFSVLSSQETKDNKMLTGDEYFWLSDTKTSYNGQYLVNGKMADVYVGEKVDPKSNKKLVLSWAFSTEKTRVVENENVEKNVLLRMYARPETGLGYKGVTIINFYNFAREEPNVFTYDITSCFNETSSKTLVFTFPAYDSLRGLEKMIGMLTHLAIKDATGIRKQRIYTKEVIFSGKYIYAAFTLVEDSPVKGKEKDKERSVDEALAILKEAIKDGKFTVTIPTSETETVSLRPEPDGLNVFAGDRSTKPKVVGYKEGSVISLTIGMLFLGIFLGGVTLNLVMSKKFGVSLFQKFRPGDTEFNNPLDESKI